MSAQLQSQPQTLTQEEKLALAARGFADPVWFCSWFLAKWFPGEIPWVHRGVLAILTRQCDFLEAYGEVDQIIQNFVYEDKLDRTIHPIFSRGEDGVLHMALGKNTLVLMPRGYSKTTILNAVNLRKILYQERRFPVYISKTGRHAGRQLAAITKQLTSNDRVRLVFGDVKPQQRNDAGLRWSESEGFIQTTTGISMLALGRGGQVRGALDDGQRPDDLTVDDLEDQESTKTDSRREDTRDWFFSDLLPVLPELDQTATVTMLSNLVHFDCLAVHIKEDPEWTVVSLGAQAADGSMLWPQMMSPEKLERKKRSYALQGKLYRFYLEYMNQIKSPENAKFKLEYFTHQPIAEDQIAKLSIAIDPAISESDNADFCVITVAAMLTTGKLALLDQEGDIGWTPREQVDRYFALVKKWKLQGPRDKFGVESQAYQAALVHLLREEMFRRKVYFEIEKITHGQQKEARIEGVLQPRYANGYIIHQRRFGDLESSLLDWPNAKKDWADSAAMAISLLDSAAPWAAGEDIGEPEYEDLDLVFAGDWRRY